MAAGNTYVALATQTLGSAAATVTFSSISGAYTDIVLVFRGGAPSVTGVYIQINGDTGSNYSYTKVYGYGAGYGSTRYSNQTKAEIGGSWSTDNNTIIANLQNYSNTSTYKSVVYRQSDATDTVTAGVTLWRSTSAINQIVFSLDAGNFSSGSNFSLYGILAA